MEIERKFLIDGFPSDLPLLKEAEVEQGYLATAPVVRIRRETVGGAPSHVLCFKGKGTLARQEVELPPTAETFRQLEDLLPAPMIRKTYKVYALPDGRRLEVSLVDADTPRAFFYAEVEFDTLEQARAFVPPACLGRDVTEEPGWSMGAYWEKTRMHQ